MQSNLALEILSDYRGLMDQIGDEQVSKDIYEGKFARIYIELERGTRLLDADREIAQETCKQQTTNETGSACDQPKSNY